MPSFPSTELITENNLLKSENMQAKQTILRLEDEVKRLKKALEELPATASADQEGENIQKYRLELQKAQQLLIQTQDKLREADERNKFLISEKDRLTAELNISMQSIKNLRDRLENIDSELIRIKQEKQLLEQKLETATGSNAQIESLNAEILRWKSENETLQQQLAHEMKIRKDIESDIQKLLGRIGGGS
jgi:chromosome segregation ATPase